MVLIQVSARPETGRRDCLERCAWRRGDSGLSAASSAVAAAALQVLIERCARSDNNSASRYSLNVDVPWVEHSRRYVTQLVNVRSRGHLCFYDVLNHCSLQAIVSMLTRLMSVGFL